MRKGHSADAVKPLLAQSFGLPRGDGDKPQRLDALFSPRGEGARRADEGAARQNIYSCPSLSLSAFAALPLTPSSACRHLLPAGEKGIVAVPRSPFTPPRRDRRWAGAPD